MEKIKVLINEDWVATVETESHAKEIAARYGSKANKMQNTDWLISRLPEQIKVKYNEESVVEFIELLPVKGVTDDMSIEFDVHAYFHAHLEEDIFFIYNVNVGSMPVYKNRLRDEIEKRLVIG